MPPNYQAALEVIVKYLKHHLPGASIAGYAGQLAIDVEIGSERQRLSFGDHQLDDLDVALTDGTVSAPYKNGLIQDMTFGALVAIGKRGMAPDVRVSSLLTNGNVDWRKHVTVATSFDAETSRKLYEGLKHLDSFAARLLGSAAVPAIADERKVMESMTEWYEKKGNLNSSAASGESLSYLKAAAYIWLRSLEADMDGDTSKRVRSAKSIRVFEVAEKFWLLRPYSRIPLPPIFDDYISQKTTNDTAGALGPSIDIGPQLRKVDPRLEERWRGAWQALGSDNPDRVSQAANSMVEVLDQVISRVCDGREFKDVLAERYPMQEKVVLAQRAMIGTLKETLHAVKHETNSQSVHTAEYLMHATEGVIRTLLR